MTFETDALFRICDILEKNSIPYWLCNGTLLGVIRDSKLIPWDEDLDFGVSVDYSEQVREIFKREIFEIINDGKGSNFLALCHKEGKNLIKIDINFYEQDGKELKSLWKVPNTNRYFNFLQKIVEKIGLDCRNSAIYWTFSGYSSLEKDVFPTKEIDFAGRFVSVPNNPEACLAYTYGETWKIANKNYDWREDGSNLVRKKGFFN